MTKLQQKVQLLSSVGTATQQAETNDVVRQIRERHAKEIAVWQSTAADLESQLLIYKVNYNEYYLNMLVFSKSILLGNYAVS